MNRSRLGAGIRAAALAAGLAAATACSSAHTLTVQTPTAQSPTVHTPIAHTPTVPATTHASTAAPTGSGRPGLATVGDILYAGWTSPAATGDAGALNLGWTTDGGSTFTMVANSESTALGEGPALDGDGRGVLVAWTDGAHLLNLAYSTGTALTCKTTFSGVTSPYSPALADSGSGVRSLAWADDTGHLNFAQVDTTACGATGAITLTGRNTVPNTTIAGPALVYDTTSAGLGLVVAWVGTDSAHDINIASYVNTTTLAHTVQLAPNPPAASTSAPGMAASAADLYLRFRGTDGKLYTAYSEGCLPTCFSARTDGTLIGSGVGMTGGQRTWIAYFDSSHKLVVTGF
jgi:hypothetical protein